MLEIRYVIERKSLHRATYFVFFSGRNEGKKGERGKGDHSLLVGTELSQREEKNHRNFQLHTRHVFLSRTFTRKSLI